MSGISTAIAVKHSPKELNPLQVKHTPLPRNRFIQSIPETTSGVISLYGIKTLKDRMIRFNKERAEIFHSLPTFEGERPLRKSHSAYLMNCYLRHTFMPETVIIMTCMVGKTEYRINGQHTASMVRSLAVNNLSICIPFRCIQYKAKSMEQMKALYTSVDRGAPRTIGNQIVALLSGTPGFDGIKNDMIRRMAEGMNRFAFSTSHERCRHDTQDRSALMRGKYFETTKNIARLFQGFTPDQTRHVMRASVIGAMYATYEMARNHSGEFWRGVVTGENLRGKNNPILKLRDHLRTSGVRDKGSSLLKTHVPAEQMYRQCLVAWNAYREGQDITRIPFTPETQPRPKAK